MALTHSALHIDLKCDEVTADSHPEQLLRGLSDHRIIHEENFFSKRKVLVLTLEMQQ